MERPHPIYSFQQFSFQCAICTHLFAGSIALGCVRRVGDAIKKRAGVFPIEPSSLCSMWQWPSRRRSDVWTVGNRAEPRYAKISVIEY